MTFRMAAELATVFAVILKVFDLDCFDFVWKGLKVRFKSYLIFSLSDFFYWKRINVFFVVF